MTGYHRFFGKPQTMFEQMMRWFRGKQEPVRFANRPAWLKAELLDKAAAKRKMRADKRLKIEKKMEWRRTHGW